MVLALVLIACVGSLPWTAGGGGSSSAARLYERVDLERNLLPPVWAPHLDDEAARREAAADQSDQSLFLLGSDRLGRDVLARLLVGGSISLTIGLAAALISVIIGTLYGMTAGYFGGRIDAVMMRFVDILYGLPYILLVVLLAVAVDGLLQRAESGPVIDWLRSHGPAVRVVTLLIAIGGVSWLTMARVIRGQVLSLREQPFMEACRAIGVPWKRQFARHLLPNLLGPIVVYATLTVPQAILQESFLSFLGIGVQPPLPSWGNLAAEGLNELNPVRSRWWLLLWPCILLALTLLSLNFVGERLREAFDPHGRRPA